jgi:hypothetical protein
MTSDHESRSLERAPLPGRLDLSQGAPTRGYEFSTEPSEQQLAADRERDNVPDHNRQALESTPQELWPKQDQDSPEYAHLTDIAAPTSFNVTPADVDTLIAANRFKPEGQSNVIALAIRGSVLTQPHELLFS